MFLADADSQAVDHLFSDLLYGSRQIIRIRRLHSQNWPHKTKLYRCILQLPHSYRPPAAQSRLRRSQFSLQSSLRSSLACRNHRRLILNLQSFLPLSEPDREGERLFLLCSVCSVATQQIYMTTKYGADSTACEFSLSCSTSPQIDLQLLFSVLREVEHKVLFCKSEATTAEHKETERQFCFLLVCFLHSQTSSVVSSAGRWETSGCF